MDSKELLDLLDRNLNRQLTWIQSADSKASTVLAFDTGLIGLLAALASTNGVHSAVALAAIVLSGLLLSISILCVCMAAFPRLKAPASSLIYFGEIVRHKQLDFVSKVISVDIAAWIDDAAVQCYRNAEIAWSKHRHIRSALSVLFVALIPWVIAVSALLKGAGES